MHHHPALRQRERYEHPDHVERDQGVRVAAEHDEQRAGQHAQDQDAVRKRQPIALIHELARKKSIARDDRRQPREVCVRSVRGEDQNEHRRRLAPRNRTGCRSPKVFLAICDTTVSVSLGTMPYACASSVIPMNIAMDRTAIVTSVDAAFRLSGGRNAGTPFETASTPVIAVQPFENAVRIREHAQRGKPPVPSGRPPMAVARGSIVPVRYLHAPTPIMASMLR